MKTSVEGEMARTKNAEKYFEHLMHAGSKIPVKFEKLIPPLWYDDEKFKRGQQFIRENHFFIGTSMLFTPFIFLVEPKFDTLFLSTGKYDTFHTAGRAHFSASSKIWSWMNGDIYEKNSTPYKGLFVGGSIHNINGAKRIDGRIGITQKDLVIGVFAFTAILVSEFEYFYSLDKEKFEGYIHYWRVIGYHIGQMDEFNLYKGDAYEVKKKLEIVFQSIFKPKLENPPKVDGKIYTDMMRLASQLFPGVSKEAVIELVRRKYKLSPKPLESEKSKIFVWTMMFVHDKILKSRWISPIARPILNCLSKCGFDYLSKYMKLIGYKI